MAKTKFYTVWKGLTPGVYSTWVECEAQVKGVKGAQFKSFDSKEAAEQALADGPNTGLKPKKKSESQEKVQSVPPAYIQESISVDAACSGNPGELEYQGVDTNTGEQIFASEKYPVGTNNLGEFLAVVHALRHLYESGSTIPIYSDSVSAIAWVRNKRVKTNLERNQNTEALWRDIDAAVDWLYDHDYPNPILKWETKAWGEVKAAFGRK